MNWPSSEIQLNEAFSDLLISKGYDVHREVKPRGWKSSIDLVTFKSGVVAGIEGKLSFNLEVIVQAERLLKHVNYAVCIAPLPSEKTRNGAIHRKLLNLCKKSGIGVLFAELCDTGEVIWHKALKSRKLHPNPKNLQEITDALGEATRRFNTSGTNGRRYTNQQCEWDDVREELAKQNHQSVKAIAAVLGMTPERRRRLLKAADRGAIAQVTTYQQGGLTFLRFEDQDGCAA